MPQWRQSALKKWEMFSFKMTLALQRFCGLCPFFQETDKCRKNGNSRTDWEQQNRTDCSFCAKTTQRDQGLPRPTWELTKSESGSHTSKAMWSVLDPANAANSSRTRVTARTDKYEVTCLSCKRWLSWQGANRERQSSVFLRVTPLPVGHK